MRAILILLVWLAMPTAAQESARPVLRMSLEKEAAVPGQPIVLRVTVLAPTWFPRAPEFPSFEIPNVIVRLPPRASGPASERIDGETWSGVTRAYHLYPMIVGRFRIPPQPLIVTFADPENQKPVTVELRTEAVAFGGVAPAGAEDLNPFIAAEALTLEQTIEGKPGELEPGGAVTCTVAAAVTGVSPIFLPPLIPPLAAEDISVYPKEPVVTENMERGTVTGERVESVTYLAQAGGRHSVMPIQLHWFNLGTEQVETVAVEGFEIVVRGPLPESAQTFDWRAAYAWVMAAIVLVALAAATVTIKLWPRMAGWRRRRREAYLASEAFAFAQAKQTLRRRDFSAAVRAVERWSSRLPSAHGAEQTRLRAALTRLGASLYGHPPQPASHKHWSEALKALQAARLEALAAVSEDRAGNRLPPLNPRPKRTGSYGASDKYC